MMAGWDVAMYKDRACVHNGSTMYLGPEKTGGLKKMQFAASLLKRLFVHGVRPVLGTLASVLRSASDVRVLRARQKKECPAPPRKAELCATPA
jgi:hypothetical protein